jgi:hypothetical protein
MTPEEDALARVVHLLAACGIPYMVTGSIAASFYGRPRATQDADIVIDPGPAELARLLAELESAGFYVERDGATRALRDRRQFNVIEMARATKIDLIVRKDRTFSVEEFGRRVQRDLPFAPATFIVTPEDSIVSKLEWARRSGESERQLRDVAGILELNPGLDREYIARWAGQLGVADLWERTVASS